MNDQMNPILADSRSLAKGATRAPAPQCRARLLIDQEAVEGGDPDALANAMLVGAELTIVRGRIGAYLAAVRDGKSALHAAK